VGSGVRELRNLWASRFELLRGVLGGRLRAGLAGGLLARAQEHALLLLPPHGHHFSSRHSLAQRLALLRAQVPLRLRSRHHWHFRPRARHGDRRQTAARPDQRHWLLLLHCR